MRPRPDAAENLDADSIGFDLSEASMRPRPDAAENGITAASQTAVTWASMRPRPDAAENSGRYVIWSHPVNGLQ